MPIYLVTPLSEEAKALVGEAVSTEIAKKDVFALQGGAGFLIDFAGTTVELSHAIKITDPERKVGEVGSAMVTSVGSYYGRGPTTMWEWLKNRVERAG